ncbi:MAG: glycosyltransferase [Chitinophagaceae bacterium]
MISIIICSVNAKMLNNLKKNIEETIGVPYEIIATDNSIRNHGICRVYNEAGARARFSYLCFAHEDIQFETENWGNIIAGHLSNRNIGLIGIAGGDAKSMVPSSWSIPIISNEIHLVQHFKSADSPPKRISETNPHTSGNSKNVTALDGVLLCTRKEVFDQFKFDDINLQGFHGYDIDYSLQVNTKYRVCAISDIMLHHFSDGKPDKKWVESAILISKKWKKSLPVSAASFSKEQYNLHHWHSFRIFIQHLFRLKYSYPIITKFYLTYSFNRFFSLRRFLSLGKYILIRDHKPHPLKGG